MVHTAPTSGQPASTILCHFHLSEKCHPEDCYSSGPGSLPVRLLQLEASNMEGRTGRRAPAEFTDRLSQTPVHCQHRNSCHLWILQLCFVTAWIGLVLKTNLSLKTDMPGMVNR